MTIRWRGSYDVTQMFPINIFLVEKQKSSESKRLGKQKNSENQKVVSIEAKSLCYVIWVDNFMYFWVISSTITFF